MCKTEVLEELEVVKLDAVNISKIRTRRRRSRSNRSESISISRSRIRKNCLII